MSFIIRLPAETSIPRVNFLTLSGVRILSLLQIETCCTLAAGTRDCDDIDSP